MVVITRKELAQLDQQIDSSIAALKILSQPRDVALIHLLRYFEDYVRLYASKYIGSLSHQVALKNGQSGMHFAVQWIFKHCPPPLGGPTYKTGDQVYRQAHDLHEKAMDYSMVWDLMTMVWRRRATAEREADGTIRIQYANQLATDSEVADRFMGTSDDPSIGAGSLHPSIGPENFLQEIQTIKAGGGNTKYTVPASVFDKVALAFRNHAYQLSELDESWNLGGYTISQFRELWIGLLTLCWIHFWACLSSDKKGGDLDNTIIISSREEWVKRLGKNCGMADATVNTILGDLVYDIGLYKSNSKQPDVTYQPFFPLHSDLLALSNWLVLLSSYERNIWDLVSIERPEIHSILRNEKEQVWLSELKPLLNSYGFSTHGPIKFTLDGQTSDLDLLIIDERDKFGLCCQLKWLTAPDRIRDVEYTERELGVGLAQAQLSQKWVTSSLTELSKRIAVSHDGLQQLEFRSLVLSKNTIGSGWKYLSGTPIVNERLLKWVLGEPHHKSLRSLWQVGEERRYLPKRKKHFQDEDVRVSFANINFLGKDMGARIIGSWDPASDININGLD
jgi:hypothetical protein